MAMVYQGGMASGAGAFQSYQGMAAGGGAGTGAFQSYQGRGAGFVASGPNGGMAAGGCCGGSASAGECTGACGGLETACCEAAGAVTNTSWQYVGPGNGAFTSNQTYTYVGEG
eukprot:CAMPEP_0179040224 /NCGR_PEP_ID=MMETSP0796-20121207/15538_1 /TAXON_ID=73915 /ORGANISM="Pyrodinium bahamense, Strain pbaha01" /LENGTH=112 /DNA_ID=CAMNT_0020736565 /DNA_START=57 /DNA_END=392 /DNA_ORIENTATION=+